MNSCILSICFSHIAVSFSSGHVYNNIAQPATTTTTSTKTIAMLSLKAKPQEKLKTT